MHSAQVIQHKLPSSTPAALAHQANAGPPPALLIPFHQAARLSTKAATELFPRDPEFSPEKNLTLVTVNVMHPFPAHVVGHWQSTVQRAKNLSHFLRNENAPVVITQESYKLMQESMDDQGYTVLNADKKELAAHAWSGTQARLKEIQERKAYPILLQKFLHLYNFKLSFTGLSTYVDKGKFDVIHHEFRRFSDHAQAGFYWSWNIFSTLLLSTGKVRTDGMQVIHVRKKNEDEPYPERIFVNLHLESFNEKVRKRQIAEVVEELKFLHTQCPTLPIQIGGDFNHSQLRGISKLFKEELGASGLKEEKIRDTFPRLGAIDGLYTIAPEGMSAECRGETVPPPNKSTDHHMVSHVAILKAA